MTNRFMKDLNAEFLHKIVSHPQVVVAGKHIDRNSGIGPIRQPALKSGKALGNRMAVLEPKVKDVTD